MEVGYGWERIVGSSVDAGMEPQVRRWECTYCAVASLCEDLLSPLW
jgi:hypothetical protein